MGPTLVGREQEVATALESLELLAAGNAALAIEGEAGIGKSALWELAVGAARERGLQVLEARPSEAEQALSYAALGDLLRPELDALEALPGPQRRALEVALLLADPDGAAPDQRAIAVATLGALRALSEAQPLALAIDDLQWLDADSARALTFALRRLAGEPLLALLARRSDRPAGLPLGLDAWDDARVLRVRLAPLGPTDMHALLAERLGLRLARPLLLRVHAAAGGNPLYGLELGRALLRHEGRLAPTAALPEPETLEGVVGERLGALSPAAQLVLAAVAALAEPRPAVVGAIADEAPSGIEEALASGVLQLDDDRLRLAHPLFGSVATARLRPDRRRLLHRRLADLVEDFEQRALHVALAAQAPDRDAARGRRRGGPPCRSARRPRRRAPARRARAPARARRARGGARRAGPRGLRPRVRRRRHGARGATAGRRARAGRPAQRAWVLVRLAMLATYDGSILEARELAEQALREAVDDPAARVVVLRRLALTHLLRAELSEAERHAASAAELAEASEPRESAARALANLACIQALRGRWAEASPAIERALALEGAPGAASIDDSPSAVAGLLLMYRGELGAARERLRHALAQAQAAGGDPLSTGLLFALSELESRAGRFHEARELAIRGSDRVGADRSADGADGAALRPRAGRGAPRRGGRRSRRGRGRPGHRRTGRAPLRRGAEPLGARAPRTLRRAGGRGVGRARPAVALLREGEVGELGVVPVHAEAIDALLMLGDVERARALAAELDAAARWPWLRAAAARCRGLLLAAEGDTDGAVRELTGAVEQHRAARHAVRACPHRAGARERAAPGQAARRRRGRRWRRPRRRSRRWARRGGPTAPAPRRRGSAAAGRAMTPG